MEKKLSVVLTGRNDNYGGYFNARLQNTIQWLHYWLTRYHISSEIILVNYNPIPTAEAIEQMIDIPPANEWVHTRMIEVPEQEHQKIQAADVRRPVPVIEFVAKNIGIRRAMGKYVVATNADVIFDAKIFEYISKHHLDDNSFYRAARVDFRSDEQIKFEQNPEWFIKVIRQNVYRFFLQGGTFDDTSPMPLWWKLAYLRTFNTIRKMVYTFIYPFRNILKYLMIPYTNELFTFKWFCNASGDFMLMSKAGWINGKGYPEDTWISTHTDSLHLVMTAVSGMKQKTLPYLVYHQEHERRFDFGGYDADMELMYNRLLSEGKEMMAIKKSLNNNTDNWGLNGVTLPEQII